MSESPWYQAAFGAHYTLLYAHRDEEEARQCLALLPSLAPLKGPVLDLGCGDGRHLELLRQAEITAVGLDLSSHLLALAAGRLDGAAPLVQGDMRQLPFNAGSFGTVLSLFTAFGYFGSPPENAGPVREVSRLLRPGGHWFLDYFDGERVRAELGDGRAHVRRRELGCLQVVETRRYHAERRQVVKDVELSALAGQEREAAAVGIGPSGLIYAEQVAVFDLDELEEMAAESGLIRVASAGDYSGGALGSGSRWILAFRKQDEGEA